MRFEDTADAPEAKARLEALPARISEIRSLDVGLDVLRSAVSFDLVLVTTYDTLEDLKAYQVHPVHEEFLAWVGPRLAARAVVDAEV
jgi:hypothetical protein